MFFVFLSIKLHHCSRVTASVAIEMRISGTACLNASAHDSCTNHYLRPMSSLDTLPHIKVWIVKSPTLLN